MAHTYAEFVSRLENGEDIVIPVNELLRILLSGKFPDGSTFDGVAVSITSVTGALPAGTNSIGGTKDDGPQWTSVFGISGARFTSADQSGADADITDAPTSGEKLVITDLVISVDTDMRVDLKEETSGTVVMSVYMAENSTIQVTPRTEMKLATADKKLQVRTSAAGNVAITPYYFSE